MNRILSTPLRKALFLFCFSWAIHIPGLTSPLLDFHGWAQTLRASTTRDYYEHGMHFFHPEVDYIETWSANSAPQFPLYSYLVALLYQVFGPHDWLGRVLSSFFAAGSAVLLYFLVRMFLGEWAGFWSGLVYCVIPVAVYFTRAVMPESMTIFCFLAGIHGTVRWTERERFWPWGALAWLALTLAFLLKLPYLPLILVPAFLVLRRWGWKTFRRADVWLFLVLFALAYFGWYGTSNDRIAVAHKTSFWEVMLGHMQLLKEWSDPEFWSTIFLSRFPELLTTYAGLLFFFVGFRVLWRSGDRFFPAWLAATVLYVLLCGEYARVHQYVVLPFAPINSVFIAIGLLELWGRWKNRAGPRALLILMVVSMPVHAAFRIGHWYRLDERWVLHAREVVAEKTKPDDLFYVDAFDMPFYLYHLHRRGWTGQLAKSRAAFNQALQGGAKVLFSPNSEGWKKIEPEIAKRYRLIYRDDDFVLYDLTDSFQGHV